MQHLLLSSILQAVKNNHLFTAIYTYKQLCFNIVRNLLLTVNSKVIIYIFTQEIIISQ